MAFPLVPFVAGAVVGCVASYLYRDEKIRDDIQQVSNKVKEGASSVSDKVSSKISEFKKAQPAEEAVVEAESEVSEEAVETKEPSI